jgi:Uma2 family endonuclease
VKASRQHACLKGAETLRCACNGHTDLWYRVRMNELFSPPQRRPTQTADGLPRWRWSVAEIEHMTAAGYFHDDDRLELLGGEIVPMSPKGRRHEIVRLELGYRFTRLAPQDVFVAPEPQFNLGPDTFLVPDLLLHPRAIATPDLRGSDALLVVEVAETSLAYDLKTKATLYAAHGVPEYWVINAATLATTVYTQPSGNAYASAHEIGPNMRLVPSGVPSLAISLDTLLLHRAGSL